MPTILSTTLSWLRSSAARPTLIYALLALVVMGPLLLPGYILTLDMAWPPKLRLPTEVTSTYPLHTLLYALNLLLPSWLIQKLILLGILFDSALGAHRLAEAQFRRLGMVGYGIAPYFAGLLYAISPFTYARFMDGHWLILLAYALTPFFLLLLWRLLEHPSWRNALKLTALTLVIGFISMHSFYLLLLLGGSFTALHLWRQRGDRTYLRQIATKLATIAAAVLVANLFWVLPYMGGQTSQAQAVERFDRRQLLTFRSVGDGVIPPVLNVLTLHGYYGEQQDRFLRTTTVMPLWPLLAITLLALVALGLWQIYRHSRGDAIAWLVVALIAWLLAVGIAAPGPDGFYMFLYEHIPFYAGYREPQKFAALLALVYAITGSVAAAAVLSRLRRTAPGYLTAAAVSLFALPLLYAPTMLGGFLGQLRSIDYPKGWYQVNERISGQTQGSLLFLPWHQYQYLNFAGRTVATPAGRFFDVPVIYASNPEIGLITDTIVDQDSAAVGRVLRSAPDDPKRASRLATLGVQYIAVAKTADWRTYDYLRTDPKLTRAYETESIILYTNEAYTPR